MAYRCKFPSTSKICVSEVFPTIDRFLLFIHNDLGITLDSHTTFRRLGPDIIFILPRLPTAEFDRLGAVKWSQIAILNAFYDCTFPFGYVILEQSREKSKSERAMEQKIAETFDLAAIEWI